MADIAQCAYAAGLFDGEGCVQIYMRDGGRGTKNCLRTSLSIAGTDFRPLHWLEGLYGGSVHIYQHGSGPRNDGFTRRPLGRWAIFSNQADVFAADIHPYLMIKQEQLDLWIEARGVMYPKGYHPPLGISQDEIDHRSSLVTRVRELKRVG